MKTVTIGAMVALLLTSSLYAGHNDRGFDRGFRGHFSPVQNVRMSNHHGNANWVIPLVVGGVLGYALSEPRRESVVEVNTAPTVYAPQPVYQERWVYFSDCDCQRRVLVSVR